MSRLVDIGIAIRIADREENPWFARLMDSLQAKCPGLPVEILVESAPELTKVEKRLRLFRQSEARYLALLEDDTEILHDNWLVQMVTHMSVMGRMAILNPQETRQGLLEDATLPLRQDEVQELTNVAGFCMLVDRESGVEPDVRVQTMDDLWMSLQARARGWRIGRSKGAILRHSKAPWADDNTPPWSQENRSRFGDGHAYYEQAKHEAKQRVEAKLMIETFGDLARLTLPKELLPWADPLHPDYGMAWNHNQPIEYRNILNGGLKNNETLARGAAVNGAEDSQGKDLAWSENAGRIGAYAEAQAE